MLQPKVGPMLAQAPDGEVVGPKEVSLDLLPVELVQPVGDRAQARPARALRFEIRPSPFDRPTFEPGLTIGPESSKQHVTITKGET